MPAKLIGFSIEEASTCHSFTESDHLLLEHGRSIICEIGVHLGRLKRSKLETRKKSDVFVNTKVAMGCSRFSGKD